jgi:hypothetical protein
MKLAVSIVISLNNEMRAFTSFGRMGLGQGWANFFVGGPNEKSKMSGGPT